MSLEAILVSVWRQALINGVREVKLNGRSFLVRRTPKKRLRQVDFSFDGGAARGLEQNPETSSRWVELARAGHSIMQFLSGGRYIGNVVDGKVTFYRRGERGRGLSR